MLVDDGYFVEEKKYIEEVSGDTKKIEIGWTATSKVSDYFKNELKISWRIIGLKNVEVEKDGKKVKMNNGSFEVKINATLIKDYANTWENSSQMKFLRGVYDRFIIESTIKQYEDILFNDLVKVAEDLKAFLTLEGRR